MGRQRVPNRVSHNSPDSGSVSEVFLSDTICDDLPEKQVENRPVFIARMPNLKEPCSIRPVLTSQSIWNYILEIKNEITDRQQILLLRSIVVLLVCMLFWCMVGRPSPNSTDPVKTADNLMAPLLNLNEEPYRSEKTTPSRSEGTYKHSAFNSSARSVRELDNDELLSVLSTTSIDLSPTDELAEETSSVFHSHQRYTPPTSSAWDRDTYSNPSTVHQGGTRNAVVSSIDSAPDFSTFAAPGYGAPPTNRYDEPQVRQVQYDQNPTTALGYSEQSAPLYSQRNPQFPENTPSVYQSAQTPQIPGLNGQQYSGEASFNATGQYQSPLSHPNRDPRDFVNQQSYNNPSNFREEIPATVTNNTYRNPGTSQVSNAVQMNAPTTYTQGGYYGQNNPQQPSNASQQYSQQYGQPNYGTAVYPVNSLNR